MADFSNIFVTSNSPEMLMQGFMSFNIRMQINSLTAWHNTYQITPSASQKTVAITSPAEQAALNFFSQREFWLCHYTVFLSVVQSEGSTFHPQWQSSCCWGSRWYIQSSNVIPTLGQQKAHMVHECHQTTEAADSTVCECYHATWAADGTYGLWISSCNWSSRQHLQSTNIIMPTGQPMVHIVHKCLLSFCPPNLKRLHKMTCWHEFDYKQMPSTESAAVCTACLLKQNPLP